MTTREQTCGELRALGHPLRVRILEQLVAAGDRMSPVALAAELDEPLNNLSYHVQGLRVSGLIRPAGTKPRRGTLEHFYRATDRAVLLLELVDTAERAA